MWGAQTWGATTWGRSNRTPVKHSFDPGATGGWASRVQELVNQGPYLHIVMIMALQRVKSS